MELEETMELEVDDLAIVRYTHGYSIGIITKVYTIDNKEELSAMEKSHLFWGNEDRGYRMKILISTAGFEGREYIYRESSLEPFDENTKLN